MPLLEPHMGGVDNTTARGTGPDAPRGAADGWHALPAQTVAALLASGEGGLEPGEAARRLQAHGKNIIRREKVDGPLTILVRQLANPIMYLLMGSGVLAIVMGKPLDGAVVLAVVVLNAMVGFVQELRATKAIHALSKMVPDLATVVRGGRKQQLPAEDLVPGDAIELAAGDRIAADSRLVSSKGLMVQEAALTGESVPSQKAAAAVGQDAPLGDRTSMVFGGTLVTAGTASALVVSTGGQTELGRISSMLESATELETPLTKALARVSNTLTVAIGALAVLLLVVGMLRGYGAVEALLAAIALAVAAIPEGLPAIVTIALAIGVQRMAKRRAVIRKLPAVETLGSTSVICSDKTGTLTRNEMMVQEIWTPLEGTLRLTGTGYAPEGSFVRDGSVVGAIPPGTRELLEAAVLCNDASVHRAASGWELAGDPTEGALVVAALKAGTDVEELRRDRKRIDVLPFDSERQLMATLNGRATAAPMLVVKGAPEVVIARCEGDAMRAAAIAAAEAMAERGMRVLAVAAKSLPASTSSIGDHDLGSLRLLGLQAMIDPPRSEAIEAVATCRAAGISVKMITGDHKKTAAAIAADLGIADARTVVTGAELASMGDAQLQAVAARCNVFARVAPEHKLRLVRALQAGGQVVAMTGDGVNDAPALKQANIGVAMGITGTSVSKEAADVVLADDNFASIAAAVEEGRRVYDNLVKALAFVLPTNLGLALILTAAVAFFPLVPEGDRLVPLLPALPVQLLWINLVAAVALALPLAFEAKERDVMARSPRAADAPILGSFVIARTVIVAVLMAAGALGLFLWEYTSEVPRVGHAVALREAQTMTVTAVVLFQVFYLFNCRSLHESVFKIGLFSNPVVYAGVGVLLVAQLLFIYLPAMQGVFGTASLDPKALLYATLVGASILPVVTIEKWLHARRRRCDAATPHPSEVVTT